MLRVTLLCLLLGSLSSIPLSQDKNDKNEESSGDTIEDDDLSISDLLEKANKDLGKSPTDPEVRELDIAVGYGLQNADPCTEKGCLWPKAKDGKVYVPYTISKQYSKKEKAKIEEGLRSFKQLQPPHSRPLTCIRFIPRTKEKNFLEIKSDKGCYSYLGKQGGPQNVSLERNGCLSTRTIQHELLHALGFDHEQCRSDRDLHVKIQLENVEPAQKHNFRKIKTNNLGTIYDYGSIMQYGRTAFSINGKPTIVPIPDANVEIGMAKKMSVNDVIRVNILYKCCTCFTCN